MRWYIASRRRHAEIVSQLYGILRENGHEVMFDWTNAGKIELTPESRAKNARLADLMGYAVSSSEVFVMISDPEGTDMYLELGIAVSNRQMEQKPRVYCVGNYNYGSLMQHHPSIEHADSIKEVFARECPEIATKYDSKLMTIDGVLKDYFSIPSQTLSAHPLPRNP